MNHFGLPIEPVHPHAAIKSVTDSAYAVAEFIHTQHGLLIDVGAALSCAAFSMSVVIGIYFLLDGR